MADTCEPKAKRMRTDLQDKDDGSCADATVAQSNRLEVILPDYLVKPLQYERCVMAQIGDKRALSAFVQQLNKSFPLPAFQHLKRVFRTEVFLFPLNLFREHIDCDQLTTVTDELTARLKKYMVVKGFTEQMLANCTFRIGKVPAAVPQLRAQYEETLPIWPCKFHEDKSLERLFRNDLFTAKESEFHCQMMQACLQLCESQGFEGAAVAHDPGKNEIVSLGWREGTANDMIPGTHAVMRVVDNVAKTQGGGAGIYGEADVELLQKAMTTMNTLFDGFKAAHCERASAQKYGPYLCTGLDVYLTDEPCLMCAMALVHSRVRRIFFHRPNVRNGALGGVAGQLKLHGVRQLNHHYDVFRVKL